LVVDEDRHLVGILTDGDIRRSLEYGYDFLSCEVGRLMNTQPLTIAAEKLAVEALKVMEKHQPRPITVLPVINDSRQVIGIIHLTDLLRKGVV
jgi:arabinose-5-phosphate isomerase